VIMQSILPTTTLCSAPPSSSTQSDAASSIDSDAPPSTSARASQDDATTRFGTVLHACLQSLPILASQLDEATRQIEQAVVEVCENFRAISQRAQEAVAGNPLLHAEVRQENTGQSMGFEGLISKTRTMLSDFLQRMEQNNQFSGQTVERMQSFEQQIRSVRETLYGMDNVASNARLLALNGQIEAARAGRQGATFAIVAKGTAEMAQHAADFSKTIRGLIDGVATNIKDASTKLQDRTTADNREATARRIDVNRMLDSMAAVHEEMQQTISASKASSESLACDISQAVVAMQFQDAVGQRIGHVIRSLQEMHALYLQYINYGDVPRSSTGQSSSQTEHWTKDMAKHYTMEVERAVLATNLQQDVPQDEGGNCNVELF
jgi:methyl-accepting chemotaxis protein